MGWEWFNVLTFGLNTEYGSDDAACEASLERALAKLNGLAAAARSFVEATAGWPAAEADVGLYFHVYGWNSVNALHLHVVDLTAVGPTYGVCEHKNLPLAAAVATLEAELVELRATRAAAAAVANPPDSIPKATPQPTSTTPNDHVPTAAAAAASALVAVAELGQVSPSTAAAYALGFAAGTRFT